MNVISRRYGRWSPGNITPTNEKYIWITIWTSTKQKFRVECKELSVNKTKESLMANGFCDTDGTLYRVDKIKVK